MGTLALSSDADPAQAAAALLQSKEAQAQLQGPNGISEAVLVDSAWTPSNGGKISTNCALVMENAADGYKRPNILDVKLGARLWADDAPPEKRAKLDKVAGETTSKPLGFRIAGMRIWHGLDSAGHDEVHADGYRFYDKEYGRAFTPATVVEGFEDYFRLPRQTKPTKRQAQVIKRFIEDLERLKAILEHKESRMYSASLLFVYEGESMALREAIRTESRLADVIEAESDPTLSGNSNFQYESEPYSQVASTPNGPTGQVDSDSAVTNTIDARSIAENSAAEYHAVEPSVPSRDSHDGGEIEWPRIQTLKLIDFAHAEWTPNQGRDENLLYGIRNVIGILNELLG